MIKVLCAGDFHDSPELSKDRFRWFGNMIVEEKPDLVFCCGDFATFDSLNTHVKNDSLEGKLKPSFDEDMASMKEALVELHKPLNEYNARQRASKHKPFNPKFVITLGNHEDRARTYGQKNPEVGMKFHAEICALLSGFGWEVIPYQHYWYLNEVAFNHAPVDASRKPMAGANCSVNAATHLMHDLVHGHTHRAQVIRKPKMGENKYVTVVDLGCSLPYGYVEDYAKHGMTGWSWGFTVLHIDQRIESWNYINMKLVERDYANA
jgi:predicted phosphodiesterase